MTPELDQEIKEVLAKVDNTLYWSYRPNPMREFRSFMENEETRRFIEAKEKELGLK